MKTTTLDQQVADIESAKQHGQDARFLHQARVESVVKKLLFLCGPTEIDGIEVSVEQNFECQNLYATRTIKRGCVKWRKKDSLFSLSNPWTVMENLVPILLNGALEKARARELSARDEAQRKLDAITPIYEIVCNRR